MGEIIGIGIDGGSVNIGLAVMSFPETKLLGHYELNLSPRDNLDDRLKEITFWLNSVFREINTKFVNQVSYSRGPVKFVTIEETYYSKGQRTPIVLGKVIGVCCAVAALWFNVASFTVYPATAKKALTGQSAATKDYMQQIVQWRFFNQEGNPKDYGITEHWADAVGVCLAGYNEYKLQQISGG